MFELVRVYGEENRGKRNVDGVCVLYFSRLCTQLPYLYTDAACTSTNVFAGLLVFRLSIELCVCVTAGESSTPHASPLLLRKMMTLPQSESQLCSNLRTIEIYKSIGGAQILQSEESETNFQGPLEPTPLCI